ncbi:protein YnhH [Scandinavium sp. UTDF21-P1B]|uniref:protein YnhH n=1 Tax=Scandinavium sp. UTDF21-P1B TaxID=3446379 RepID=UPI003F5388EE
MRPDSFLNGFSALDCIKNNPKCHPSHVAVNQAHFPLHAFLMSPILNSWHSNFRNTGLTSWQCAHEHRFPYPSQLKD